MPRLITGRNRKRRLESSTIWGIVAVLFLAALLFKSFLFNEGKISDSGLSAELMARLDTVQLPVPLQAIPPGKKLDESDFELAEFPKSVASSSVIKDISTMKGSTAMVRLPEKLPITFGQVSLNGQSGNPILDEVTDGMRAMTIKVDATSAVEGWAGSGSYVDVLLVERDKTSVVAERVKILSAERSVVPVESGTAPSVPSTVTILVTQEQCLAINTAIPLGRIALALRHSGDDKNWQRKSYDAERLRKLDNEKQRVEIRGYLSIKEQNGEKKSFALADGRWIKAGEHPPEGFFVAEDQSSKSN
jgi:Flp pilus assembly protein CpaB